MGRIDSFGTSCTRMSSSNRKEGSGTLDLTVGETGAEKPHLQEWIDRGW